MLNQLHSLMFLDIGRPLAAVCRRFCQPCCLEPCAAPCFITFMSADRLEGMLEQSETTSWNK